MRRADWHRHTFIAAVVIGQHIQHSGIGYRVLLRKLRHCLKVRKVEFTGRMMKSSPGFFIFFFLMFGLSLTQGSTKQRFDGYTLFITHAIILHCHIKNLI